MCTYVCVCACVCDVCVRMCVCVHVSCVCACVYVCVCVVEVVKVHVVKQFFGGALSMDRGTFSYRLLVSLIRWRYCTSNY